MKNIDTIQENGTLGKLGRIGGAVGIASGASSAYDRYSKGDTSGAAAQAAVAALGAGSFIPGPVGWTSLAASIVADFALDYYDKQRLEAYLSKLPKDSDPEVATVQIALNQIGENIPVDGKITPKFVELFNKHKQELEDL